jgi:hypothetical protein
MGKLTNLNPPGPIADSDIPAAIARDNEVTAAIDTHVLAADPHTQYATQARGDARYFRGRSQVHTLDPPSIGPGDLVKFFYTFVGAKPGDFCLVSPININTYTAALWPFVFTAVVEQVDTVAIGIRNDFSSAIDLGSFQIRVIVINF